jgi:hypothetical protein
MIRPRFLADHDLNEHIVTGILRQEPVCEFLRARDLGLAARSDDAILEYAERERLLVVSHGVNTMPATAFARLSRGESFPGLLMVPQSSPIGSIIDNLLLIWAASDLEEWKDHVVFLPLESCGLNGIEMGGRGRPRSTDRAAARLSPNDPPPRESRQLRLWVRGVKGIRVTPGFLLETQTSHQYSLWRSLRWTHQGRP